MVPDVFMKTKYGSTNQYNYDIKFQEPQAEPSYPIQRETQTTVIIPYVYKVLI